MESSAPTPTAPASESRYSHQLATAVSAARLAGEVIRNKCDEASVSVKSGVDLVTQVDREAESLVEDHIRAQFPSDVVIGEEEASESGESHARRGEPIDPSRPFWLVDPLDGTTNFVHGYTSFVCVCIAYCVGGVPVVGVVYNPFTDEMYEAEEGGGARCNGRPVRVDSSGENGLGDCLLVNNIGATRDGAFIADTTARVGRWLNAGLRGYRSSGSAAMNMAHVACGRVSCFYEHGYGGPWDVAAGAVLVREAGGVVRDASEGGDEGGTDLRLTYGKGSVCCGNANVVRGVIRVAGRPRVDLWKREEGGGSFSSRVAGIGIV